MRRSLRAIQGFDLNSSENVQVATAQPLLFCSSVPAMDVQAIIHGAYLGLLCGFWAFEVESDSNYLM